jgi:hypothetical protein
VSHIRLFSKELKLLRAALKWLVELNCCNKVLLLKSSCKWLTKSSARSFEVAFNLVEAHTFLSLLPTLKVFIPKSFFDWVKAFEFTIRPSESNELRINHLSSFEL